MPGITQTVSHGTTDAYLNQVFSMVREEYNKNWEQIVLHDLPLLKRNWGKAIEKTGPNIVQPVQVKEFGGTFAFRGMTAQSPSIKQTSDAAVLQWANVVTPLVIDWDTAMATGEGAAADASQLARRHVQQAADSHKRYLGFAQYIDPVGTSGTYYNPSGSAPGGTFANGITGLCNAAPATSSDTTYAGFSSATYANWKPQYDSTLTTCSIGNVEALWSLVKHNGQGNPTLALTTVKNWNRLFAQNQPAQLLEVKSKAELGFTSLVLQGMEIMADWFAPSYYYGNTLSLNNYVNIYDGDSTISNPLVPTTTNAEYLYIICEDTMDLIVHPRAKMAFEDFAYMGVAGYEAYRAAYKTRLQLLFPNRRQLGVAVFTS